MNEHENSAFRSAEQSDFASATVDELAELFRLLELPHVLVGGHAVNQYTAPRLSYDLDFVVGGANGAATRCAKLLGMIGYELMAAKGGEDPAQPSFVRLKHAGRGVIVDIQEARTPFERELLARSRRMGDLPFAVASAEDLVVLKLISNRARDQRDILELATVEGLDLGYIRDWARRWQVMDAFTRLLDRASDAGHPDLKRRGR